MRLVEHGERGYLVRGDRGETLPSVDTLAAAFEGRRGIVEIVAGLDAHLLVVDPLIVDREELRKEIARIAPSITPDKHVAPPPRAIDVEFGGASGPDLEEAAGLLGLEPREVVRLLTERPLHIEMIGFTHGFPYLGGLPKELALPRRASPRATVPRGSIAIAAGMAGIYPVEAPGGWWIIGRTSQQLFDPTVVPPALLAVGERVLLREAERRS